MLGVPIARTVHIDTAFMGSAKSVPSSGRARPRLCDKDQQAMVDLQIFKWDSHGFAWIHLFNVLSAILPGEKHFLLFSARSGTAASRQASVGLLLAVLAGGAK